MAIIDSYADAIDLSDQLEWKPEDLIIAFILIWWSLVGTLLIVIYIGKIWEFEKGLSEKCHQQPEFTEL